MISQNFSTKLNLLNTAFSVGGSDQCLFNSNLSNNSSVWKNASFEEISKALSSGELGISNGVSTDDEALPVSMSAIMLSSLEKVTTIANPHHHNHENQPFSKAIKLEDSTDRVQVQSNGSGNTLCTTETTTTTTNQQDINNKKKITFVFYLPLEERPSHLTIYTILDHCLDETSSKDSLTRYLTALEHNNQLPPPPTTEPHTKFLQNNVLAVSVCKLPENLNYPPGSAGISSSLSTMLHQDDSHVLNQVKAIQSLIQNNGHESISVEETKKRKESCDCNQASSSFDFFYQCDPISYSFNGPNHRWLNRLMRNLTTI